VLPDGSPVLGLGDRLRNLEVLPALRARDLLAGGIVLGLEAHSAGGAGELDHERTSSMETGD
jgi:hypothetical protein